MNDLFLANAPLAGITNAEERELFRGELLVLLEEQTKRYTHGKSSSVRVEVAEELLHGILYCIELHLSMNPDDDPTEIGPMALYEAGLADAKRLKKRGWLLFKRAQENRLSIPNIAYNDTIDGFKEFFNSYNAEFFAHRIPCDIDYPLCHPVSETLEGVEYVCEYLRRINMENEFLTKFAVADITELLNSYCDDHTGLIINLYSPVMESAIGRALLHKPMTTLGLNAADRSALLSSFKPMSDDELTSALRAAAQAVCGELHMDGAMACEYMCSASEVLNERIRAAVQAGDIGSIFLSLASNSSLDLAQSYFDNPNMSDEALRKLIDELRDCANVNDKYALIHERVHSLGDMIEVISVAVDTNECNGLFDSLGASELQLLRLYVSERPDGWESETGWEKMLMNYVKNDDKQ